MAETFMLPEALKAAQWEVAKGHLRALVALQGSYSSSIHPSPILQQYKDLTAAVDEFIKRVEEDGLHE